MQVLAKAFNIDSTKLLGHIRGVDNFDIVDKNYNVVYDGSNIIAQMCDKAWFRIKEQDTYIDDFKNANNRSIQYYLNVIKMYKYSYFANAVCFATKMPDVNVTEMQFKEKDTSIELKENEEKTLTLLVTPPNATQEITFKSDHDSDLSVTKIDDRSCTIKGLKSTQGDQLCVITAEAGNISTTINVTAKGTE